MNTFARVLVIGIAVLLGGCGVLGRNNSVAGPGLPPELDSDADGVADAVDQCAETVLAAGDDATGCSPFTGPIAGVDFPPGGDQLGSNSREALGPLVASLLEYPDVRLEVQGHTDNRGSAPDNLDLSKRRVMSVVRYLVTEGVAPDRLDPIAFGESRPVKKNATAEGRIANRRIEVRVIAP